MPRPMRRDEVGLVHHVTARAVCGDVLFRDDLDRHAFLGRLMAVRHRWSLHVLTWCLMTNHIHLLVRQAAPSLSRAMQDLLGGYARAVNDRHERPGHLFDGRFAAKLVQNDGYGLACLAYIARNPVEAGLVPAADAYLWSGHRALAGLAPALPFHDVDAALHLLPSPFGLRAAAYRRCVDGWTAEGSDPWGTPGV
jgi:putative transposase